MNRADNIGMFWEDIEVPKPSGRAERGPRPLPPIPETGWRPPKEFPRLDSAGIISIDCETFDPELNEAGAGWGRGKGHIVGIAVGAMDELGNSPAQGWYFPMRHELQGELNLNPENVLAWARDTFANAQQPKVFTNAIYDIGWLAEEGVHVAGDICDVQIAEPLLDENAWSYSLDTLMRKYTGEGKPQDVMIDWMLDAYGGSKREIKGNIYRTPPSLVGPYAEGDVTGPLIVWKYQWDALFRENLVDLYTLESKLPHILHRMRRRGVRVDLDRAQQIDEDLTRRIAQLQDGDLKGINPNAPTDLTKYAAELGVTPPRTEAGNPSFAGKWLEQNMPKIAQLRQLYKMRDTFVRSYVLEKHVNGVLHCNFNQLKSDNTGTVSGRFSSSDPNLQNIPARDEEFGPMIRSMYVPHIGRKRWRKFDWSQIEYRLLVHYAVGRGAEAAREMFRTNPRTDFHVMTQELIWPGRPEMRKPSKNINFGLVYGMGPPLLAASLNRPEDEAAELVNTYHSRQPYVKETYNLASRRAKQREKIKTLGGRYRRFPRGLETHKALNALLQGSAADVMKTAMVQFDEAGLLEVLLDPLLIVHDEFDFDDDGSPEMDEAFKEAHHIMQTCVPLQVPLLAEAEIGPNWGNTERVK